MVRPESVMVPPDAEHAATCDIYTPKKKRVTWAGTTAGDVPNTPPSSQDSPHPFNAPDSPAGRQAVCDQACWLKPRPPADQDRADVVQSLVPSLLRGRQLRQVLRFNDSCLLTRSGQTKQMRKELDLRALRSASRLAAADPMSEVRTFMFSSFDDAPLGISFDHSRVGGEHALRVASFDPGSAAERAGIRVGSVLVGVQAASVEGLAPSVAVAVLQGNIETRPLALSFVILPNDTIEAALGKSGDRFGVLRGWLRKNSSATKLQAVVRGRAARARIQRQRALFGRILQERRRETAATLVQAAQRGNSVRCWLRSLHVCTIRLQAVARGWKARKLRETLWRRRFELEAAREGSIEDQEEWESWATSQQYAREVMKGSVATAAANVGGAVGAQLPVAHRDADPQLISARHQQAQRRVVRQQKRRTKMEVGARQQPQPHASTARNWEAGSSSRWAVAAQELSPPSSVFPASLKSERRISPQPMQSGVVLSQPRGLCSVRDQLSGSDSRVPRAQLRGGWPQSALPSGLLSKKGVNSLPAGSLSRASSSPRHYEPRATQASEIKPRLATPRGSQGLPSAWGATGLKSVSGSAIVGSSGGGGGGRGGSGGNRGLPLAAWSDERLGLGGATRPSKVAPQTHSQLHTGQHGSGGSGGGGGGAMRVRPVSSRAPVSGAHRLEHI